jgi:hypothetical protein
MNNRLKAAARWALSPILYRYPPFTLAPERLYVYLHYLIERRQVPGAVVEVGCNLGGTAAVAYRMLQRIGISKAYHCIDTFGGFVDEQFAADEGLGTPRANRHFFSGNSRALVAKILRRHGCEGVNLIQGDIVRLPDSALPEPCSVVLLDVDLTEPTAVALRRFWPRLSYGGVILVDDCGEKTDWKARIAYSEFCKEVGLEERYHYGMGIISRERRAPSA